MFFFPISAHTSLPPTTQLPLLHPPALNPPAVLGGWVALWYRFFTKPTRTLLCFGGGGVDGWSAMGSCLVMSVGNLFGDVHC